MGQIYVDTPKDGRVLVNIAGDTPSEEEQRMITERFFSDAVTKVPVTDVPEVVPQDVPEVVPQDVPEVVSQDVPVITSADDAIAAATRIDNTAKPVVEAPVVEAPVVEAPVVEAPVVEPVNAQTDELLQEKKVEEFAVVPPRETTEVPNLKNILSALHETGSAAAIVAQMYESGVTTLDIDGRPYNFSELVETGSDPQEILNTLLSGVIVRDINGIQTDALAYGNAGVTLLGLPVDLVNMFLQAGKAGVNALASINAPEGVDNPESPNYDPDFYIGPDKVSPFLGSQNIRDMFRAVGVDLPDSVREIPEEHRWRYQFSRVFGENIAFAAGLYAKALGAGTKLATNPTMHPVLRTMAENPTAVRNAEALALLGASSGAATMQQMYPNNPYGQLIGELAGGFGFTLGPSFLKTIATNQPLFKLGKVTVDKLLAASTVEGGRKFAVQELLLSAEEFRQGLLKQAKQAQADGNVAEFDRLTVQSKSYEPEVFLEALLDADMNSALPAGTATNNELLVSVQNDLMNGSNSVDFSSKVNSQISAALADIERLSKKALLGQGMGDLGELMQSRYIQLLLQAESNARANRMLQVLDAIPEGNMEAAGLVIQRILREGKGNLREMETFWWDKVDKSVMVDPDKIATTILAQRDRLPAGATIGDGASTPNQVLDELLAKVEAGENINVGEILRFRSYFLNKARMAGSGPTPDKVTADIYDNIASSAVELLNKVDGFTGVDIKMARKFSAMLNTRYNRFWVKGTQETSGAGGYSSDERMTARSMISGPEGQAEINMRDASDAANYADDMGGDTLKQQTDDALEAAANEAEIGARQAAADAPSDPNPDFARAGLIEGNTTLSMSNALKVFWDRKARPERMKEADKPKSADEAIIANARGDVLFDSTTRRFPENETAARKAPEDDVYEFAGGRMQQGPFSLNNGEFSREVMAPSERVLLGPEMSAQQELILLGEIRKLRDNSIKDSIPTEQALNSWLDNNSEVLERFPQVRAKAESLLAASEEATQYAFKVDVFKDSENFNSSVADVFNSTNPDEGFGNLVKIIKDAAVAQRKGPEDVKRAMDHLRASTFDMMLSASVKDEGFDFLSLTQQLFSPVDSKATRGTTRIEIMQKHGLIDGDEVEAIGLYLNEAVQIQRTTEAGSQFDEVLGKSAAMLDNLARIAGANVGVLAGSGQASIQTAAIGSQFMKNLVSKMPRQNALRQLELLFLQPNLLAEYISKNAGTQKRAATVIQELLNDTKTQYQDKGVVRTAGAMTWTGFKYVSKKLSDVGTQTFRENPATFTGVVTRPLTGDDSEIDSQMLDIFNEDNITDREPLRIDMRRGDLPTVK